MRFCSSESMWGAAAALRAAAMAPRAGTTQQEAPAAAPARRGPVECKIKKIGSPEETKIDDAFAKSVGTEDLKDLKTRAEIT